MSDIKEIRVTGNALNGISGGRRRRASTRKNRQEGGDNSGALLQVAAQGVASGSTMTTPQMAARAEQVAQNAFAAMRQGQRGGDNSGGLLQLATVPQMGGPMNTQAFAQEFRDTVAQTLNSKFGPDHATGQLWGGKRMRGGDGIAGTIQKQANFAPTLPGSPPPAASIDGVAAEQPAPVSGGGRVVLAAPKRRTRIALKSKKIRGGSDSGPNNVPPPLGGGAHTRKARKIHLRVKGVTARLHKAKKAKKTAMSAPISEVRSKLEAAKVIKKGSKAPESMLRNMYADLLITKKGL